MRIPNYEKPNYENFSSFFEQFHSHNLVREGNMFVIHVLGVIYYSIGYHCSIIVNLFFVMKRI